MAVLMQVLHCCAAMVLFLIPCVIVGLLLRWLAKVPDFVFRKLLHIVAFSCLTFMTCRAESWQAAALTSVVIALVIYPLLVLCEGMEWYAGFFVQKSPHEVRRSLLMLFLTYAALVFVAWGLFGRADLCIASVLMWGVGDAAAALIGIPLGRHKIRLPRTDGRKSWEGSIAMLVCSLAAGCIAFLLCGELSVKSAALLLLPGALLGTVTELYSPSEIDTVSVPVVIVSVQLIGSAVFAGML